MDELIVESFQVDLHALLYIRDRFADSSQDGIAATYVSCTKLRLGCVNYIRDV